MGDYSMFDWINSSKMDLFANGISNYKGCEDQDWACLEENIWEKHQLGCKKTIVAKVKV